MIAVRGGRNTCACILIILWKMPVFLSLQQIHFSLNSWDFFLQNIIIITQT